MTDQALTPENRANFRSLNADVFWYGVLAGSAMGFLALFATRQGASGFQVSLLTAGPAVVNLLLSLPAGRILAGRSFTRVTFWTAFWHRLGYLIFILIPWLFNPAETIWTLILLTLLMSVPGTVLAIAFNAAFAEVVPPEWRGMVVGRRNALLAFSLSATSFISGYLLNNIVFPINYQIVFAIGVIGGILSTYYLGRLIPDHGKQFKGRPMSDYAWPGLLRFADAFRLPVGLRLLTRREGSPWLRLDILRGPFGSFLGAYLIFYMFQYVPIPLLPLYLVRHLDLSDQQISIGNALFFAMMLVGSMAVGNLSRRLSHRVALVTGTVLYGLYPLLNGLAGGPFLYWVASLTGGVVWAVANSGLVNRLMERVPEGERPDYMALHNIALNVGILAGSLLGPWIAGWTGLREAMLIAAGLRFLAGLLLAIWG